MKTEWLVEQWFGEHRCLTREDFQAIKGLCGMVKKAKKPARMVEFETLSGLKVRFKTRRNKKLGMSAYKKRKIKESRHAYYMAHKEKWRDMYAKRKAKKQAMA